MVQFPVEAFQGEISQIVDNVFATMLGETPEPVNAAWDPEVNRLTSAVFFAGSWKGAVLVDCSEQLALFWTSRLMSIELPSEYSEDVEDALGEIVNMVGGNLKSVLPSGVGLSMPSVVRGRNYSIRVCGDNLSSRHAFRTEHGVFWVTLVEVEEK